MEVKMKANELRIGNLVDLGNRIAKVTEIYPLACMVADLEQTQDTLESYERVTGIPLTEELLLKFGCQRTRGGWFISADYFLYNPLTEFNIPSSKYYGLMFNDKYVTTRAVQYVHQLQNLYFALTGKELTIGGNNE
jgi:hypothetical protein